MSVSFCPACGTPKIGSNARFCHVCGASLSPEDIQARAGSDPMYATPPSAPQTPLYGTPPLGNAVPYTAAPPPAYTVASGGAMPIYDMPMYATPFAAAMPAPAVSPGRATGITFAAIGAALGFGALLFFGEYWTGFIFRFLHIGIYYFSVTRFIFSNIPIGMVAIIGSFWYSSLRLAQYPFARTWLEACGLGAAMLLLPCCIFFIIITSHIGFSSQFIIRYVAIGFLIGLLTTILATLIGVGLALTFARWQSIRPLALGLPLWRLVGTTFGVLTIVVLLLLIPLLFRLNPFFILIVSAAVISGVSFIARGMVLRRLRATRPDLFVAPPAARNSVF